MDIGRQLLLQLLLILINAFFAATEIAVLQLNGGKIERMARDGDKKASRMMKMVSNPDRFLSTIQIGITLAGFLGSAFAADNFSEYVTKFFIETCKITWVSAKAVDSISVIVITLILSYFTLVLGELVPKRIAMKHPEKLARAFCGIINGIAVILKPVVWFMAVSTSAVLKIFGINSQDNEEDVSEDDIRLLIDIGEEKGTIEADEKEMIENIFDFTNSTAGDIMIHRTSMTVIWADSTPEEITKIIRESGFSRLPVCGEDTDDILGILLAREFLLNERAEKPKPLNKLYTPAYFVPETVNANVLLRDLQSKKMHMAIVLDEFGGTAGIITLEDLLEEIVGSIYDELDTEADPTITKIGDDTWRIPGETQLDDVEKELDIELDGETESLDTFAGFVLSQLSAIPEDGEGPELEVPGLKIKVEKVSEHRIESAVVTVVPKSDESDEEKNED